MTKIFNLLTSALVTSIPSHALFDYMTK